MSVVTIDCVVVKDMAVGVGSDGAELTMKGKREWYLRQVPVQVMK